MSPVTGPVAGVLLAGGQARRMGGGDKGLLTLGGRPLLEHVIDRARPQVSSLILNTNSDPSPYAGYGLPVVADVIDGYAGPLAGILSGLEWVAANAPQAVWMASFTSDAPFIPGDLVARLAAAVEATGADLACARSDGRTHPVFGLWRIDLREELRRAMLEEDMRKIDRWTARYQIEHVDFATEPVDPFFNINRPEDLQAAEQLLVDS